MTGYEVTIKEASMELTAKERIRLKDTTNAIKLDTATDEAPLTISPKAFAILSIHNEKSDSKDYTKFLVVDTNGTKYVTGSESFITAFKDIVDEMAEAGEEGYDIEVYRMESKNYKGKSFITCSLK